MAAEKVDEQVVVEISKNKMFAVVSIKEAENGGNIVSKDDIIRALRAQNVTYGLDEQAIDNIFTNKKYGFKYLVAKGVDVVNGVDGALDFKFDKSKKSIKPKISDDGSVDFRNLDLIEMARVNQVLVKLINPIEGKPGKNIFGEVINEIKPKVVKLPKGKNVYVSEDGMELIAEIDGQISYSEGKVSIFSNYEVPANVDNSTGNINFIGNVVVKGNVLTGFTIKAGGSVQVQGVVEGAEIEAGGDIILYRGMQGMSKGVLRSGGNITAKYIENSTIEAVGDITSNAIMHSDVKCGGMIMVEGKKGLIVGGALRTSTGVVAKTIGSPMATITNVEVGVDLELIKRQKKLKEEIEKIRDEYQKTVQMVETLLKLKEANKLPPDKLVFYDRSIATKDALFTKMQSFQDEQEEIEAKLNEKSNGVIKANNVVYPGVKITIGNTFTYVREEKKFCKMVSEFGEIKFKSYS